MHKKFFAVLGCLLTGGCAWFYDSTQDLAITPSAQQEINHLASRLDMLKTEIRYDYKKGKKASGKLVFGQPFGLLPWSVGQVNERKFFIEIGELSYLQCEGLIKNRQGAVDYFINGRKDGFCDNENAIRWIFKYE